MKTVLIGIDAATDLKKCGYAIGVSVDGRVQIDRADTLCSTSCEDALSEIIGPCLKNADRALIAIDAPLGWPIAAGVELGRHMAGDQLDIAADRLFHRATDHRSRHLPRCTLFARDRRSRVNKITIKTMAYVYSCITYHLPIAGNPAPG